MRTFDIYKDYYGAGCNIHKYDELSFEPGVTVLVGCNGYGKTSIIRQLNERLQENNIPVFKYDNFIDGGHNAMSKYSFLNKFDLLCQEACSSEGEGIIINIGEFAASLGTFAREHTEHPELWVLLDGVDSGLSVDNIVDLKEFLFKTVIDDNRHKDVYIVVSANEYELVRHERCLDVYSGKYIQFKGYESYRSYILKTRKLKDKRKYKK